MNKLAALFATTVVAVSSQVMASPLGGDITIYDGNSQAGSYNDWYGSTHEDQEVEVGQSGTQLFDTEAVIKSSNYTVGLVSGFDLKNGQGQYASGDIFIDLDGDFSSNTGAYGPGQQVKDTFGYDYVLDIDWNQLTYTVFKLDADSETLTTTLNNHQFSNPWAYAGGGQQVTTGSFTLDLLTDAQTGYEGDAEIGQASHYYANGFDLSFLGEGTDFWLHYTMECGNDLLHAKGTVPTPSALALMGLGLLGLTRIRRKKA
ncbi:hypothetical protein [Zooshikella sp. RANM57]|uniref:hypothetical protein n=1 Tax=Zooshikella sp. RANM57 TaxID=3425863 RepID=UPI003D6F50DB